MEWRKPGILFLLRDFPSAAPTIVASRPHGTADSGWNRAIAGQRCSHRISGGRPAISHWNRAFAHVFVLGVAPIDVLRCSCDLADHVFQLAGCAQFHRLPPRSAAKLGHIPANSLSTAVHDPVRAFSTFASSLGTEEQLGRQSVVRNIPDDEFPDLFLFLDLRLDVDRHDWPTVAYCRSVPKLGVAHAVNQKPPAHFYHVGWGNRSFPTAHLSRVGGNHHQESGSSCHLFKKFGDARPPS